MASRAWTRACVAAALAALFAPAAALPLGAEAPRLPVGLERSPLSVLPATRHPLARPELDAGPADGGIILGGLSLVLRRSADQETALSALLARQQDPSSPDYHRWLTPETFAERFGASSLEVERLADWLAAMGFRVEGTSRSRTRVFFTGSVAQVAAAFHTQLRRYAMNGELHLANASDLSVPASLAPLVLGLRNVTDLRPLPHHLRVRHLLPDFTSSITGNHFLAPADFAAIYDVQPLYRAAFDGAGEIVAVVGQTQLDPADVAAFRAASGLPPGELQLLLVPGTGASAVSSADLVEAALDAEWSGAVAPGAKVLYVYAGDDANKNVIDALQYVVDQDLAPVVSMSYGLCEASVGGSEASAMQQLARQANAQGQTIVVASGDTGAADCEPKGSRSAVNGLGVDVPASVPEVTGIGGSELAGDAASPGTYWSTANGSGGGSALGYIPERAWNDTAVGGALAAGGGGASIFFAKPDWQVGPGVPADGRRDVPDVALSASAEHDGYLMCSQGSCVSGFRQTDGSLTVVGGTSVGAPAFAGVLTLLRHARGFAGLGNVNPTLYALAVDAPGAFHRITTGDNKVPCSTAVGSTACPVDGFLLGFSAGEAYSQAVGLGSIDAAALVAAWPAGATAVALTVTPGGSGVGTIVGAGLECSSGATAGCTVLVSPGNQVKLTAAPAAGSTFTGWGGACAGAALTCPLTPLGPTSVAAFFAIATSPVTVALTVSVTGGGTGTVTGGGLACSSGAAAGCSVSVAAGSPVTLTATPAAGATFGGWGGACTGTASSCTLTVSAATSATALFNASTPATPESSGGCGQGGGGAASFLGLALALIARGSRRLPARASRPE